MKRILGSQSGQSIVEFLVAASFVLVPMLMLTTYLGKVGDMQHRAAEASRYGVWEAAVTGKDAVRVQSEVNKRILYKDHRELDSETDGQSGNVDLTRIDPLYFHSADDGAYETLIAEEDNTFNRASSVNENPESPLYGSRVSLVHFAPARIGVAEDGMITSNIEFTTSSTKWLQNMALSQRAHNTMLAETWRAITHDQVEDSIADAILARTGLLDSLISAGAVLTKPLGLEEWENLEPGYIEHDVVPCSRLANGGSGENACK